MPKAQQCKVEDTECKETCKAEDIKCKETSMCRCGTGDTGCKGPAMCHMSDNMCNGVFGPVCAPEICNVPRIPHQQTLVAGQGILIDTEGGQKIEFNIFIEREMQVYRGELKLQDKEKGINICADVLKYYEGHEETHILAIFQEADTEQDITISIHKGEKQTLFFAYSTSLHPEILDLRGKLVLGKINIYADHNVHEH